MKKHITNTFTLLTIAVLTLGTVSCKKKGCTDPTAENYNAEAEKDDSSCHHHHDHDDEEVATATIDITSINENDVIAQGAMAMVHGTITGTGMLHGYEVKIDNTTDGTQALFFEDATHTSSYSFNQHWTNNVSTQSTMKATVTVYFDHDHTLSDSSVVNFVCE